MPKRLAKSRARMYRQVARAQSSQQNEQRILEAATTLLAERYYDEITLEDVAQLAGSSAKTVMRRFGSKEALAARFIEAVGKHNAELRDRVPAGAVEAALRMILAMYELGGDSVLRNLSLEGRVPMVTAMAEKGRQLHGAWISRVFAPCVSRQPARKKQQILLLLVATDVYTWKLLRRDRRLSEVQTYRVVRELVEAALAPSSPPKPGP